MGPVEKILRAAGKLITPDEQRCVMYYARDVHENQVSVGSPKACKWCAVGATMDPIMETNTIMEMDLGPMGISEDMETETALPTGLRETKFSATGMVPQMAMDTLLKSDDNGFGYGFCFGDGSGHGSGDGYSLKYGRVLVYRCGSGHGYGDNRGYGDAFSFGDGFGIDYGSDRDGDGNGLGFVYGSAYDDGNGYG